MGTARHLAVAARTRQRLLWGRAGFAGTRLALAIAMVEQACRYVLMAQFNFVPESAERTPFTSFKRWQLPDAAGLLVTLPLLLLSSWVPVFIGVLQKRQDFFWLGWSSILGGVGRLGIAAFVVLASRCLDRARTTATAEAAAVTAPLVQTCCL